MKRNSIAVIIILMTILNISCQNTNLKTAKYAGVYEYGDSPENGPTGQITVYPESDDSILFFMDISRGAPSYNMGNLYDRVKIKSNKGTYYAKYEYGENPCNFSLFFSGDKLIIKTKKNGYDCGFGGNVIADGVYNKVKSAEFDSFMDMTGEKYFFNKTKPEDYAK
jgi:hypothetical protein